MSKGTGERKAKDEKKAVGEEENLSAEFLDEAAVEVEQDIASVESRIEELSNEKEELLDGLLRLKAEFENYRKRMLKEQTRILDTAEAGLVKKLLTVIDNLERAVENSAGQAGSNGLREGVEMVLGQMVETLEKEGLEVIDPEGELFDPEHHEAMMVIETDECPEDTVVEVTQKGYRFKGVLLRPALVNVACPVKSRG
ncbi:MAG: nucleotide exchange factor GrpE [Actinobacteria bacterium]|nr:nucleotide exchange factor GrpE [Actinomycetota bacterium]